MSSNNEYEHQSEWKPIKKLIEDIEKQKKINLWPTPVVKSGIPYFADETYKYKATIKGNDTIWPITMSDDEKNEI